MSGSYFKKPKPISAPLGSVTVENGVGSEAVAIQDGGNSISVDVAALPLPIGASTAALQSAANTLHGTISTAIASIDAKTPALTQKQAVTLSDRLGLTDCFIEPFQALKVAELSRLCGGNFIGTVLDTQKWASTVTGSGSVTLASLGVTTLTTGATANSSAAIQSKKPGRFMTGQTNQFVCGVRLGDTGTTNNTRRWGVFDANNGYFFQLSGTVFSVVSRNAGVDSVVTTFNGATPVKDTAMRLYTIAYAGISARFYQDNILIHSLSAGTNAATGGMFSAFATLYMRIENSNSGGSISPCTLQTNSLAINRLGKLDSKPDYAHFNAPTTGTVLKQGPGTLTRVILGTKNSTSSTITFYDNTSASGNVIMVLSGDMSVGFLDLGVDFTMGLTIATTGSVGDFTVLFD